MRISSNQLKAFADMKEYNMLLDPGIHLFYADLPSDLHNTNRQLYVAVVLENRAKAGNPERGIGPINIHHDPEVTLYRPYEKIYGANLV